MPRSEPADPSAGSVQGPRVVLNSERLHDSVARVASAGSRSCWTAMREAADAAAGVRAEFARRYDRVVRACLSARWEESSLIEELDAAVEEVFLHCVRGVGTEAPRADFGEFLLAVLTDVARLREHDLAPGQAIAVDEPALASVFRRAWARQLMRQAARLQRRRARGNAWAERRVDVLRMRFREGRDREQIAARLQLTPEAVREALGKARREFAAALRDVVAFHHPGASRSEVDVECSRLITLA